MRRSVAFAIGATLMALYEWLHGSGSLLADALGFYVIFASGLALGWLARLGLERAS